MQAELLRSTRMCSTPTALRRGAEEKGMTAVHAFTDQNELVEKLRADAKPGDALLFKGSRGMRMERALAMFLGEEVEA